MNVFESLKTPRVLIALAVGLFALFAFWLRILPIFSMGNTDLISMVSMDDPFYNLRQTESLLANSFQYSWFDAMTHYPYGTSIYWGPIFPTIIALFCMLTGATTRPEIISVALLVTPLIAATIVVLMYYIGKAFGDWKTGVLASGFTAIITGQFYTISMYGYIDHHIAEVLFSTLFCLLYTGAILSAKNADINLREFTSWKQTAILSGLAGIGYLLGLFTMPTMILFAMIAGIFTLVQFVIDVFRARSSAYLLIINSTVFIIVIIGLLLFGLKDPSLGLSTYSAGHIFAYLMLVVGTAVLYALACVLRGKNPWYYPAALAGIGVLSLGALALALPQVFSMFAGGISQFFGQYAVTETVLEAQGWSFDHAWESFNFGLLLFAGGALVMAYNNWKEEHPHQVFALVWSLVMLVSTWQHMRYEYYLAINIALLSAVCIAFFIERAIPPVSHYREGIGRDRSAGTPGPAKRGSPKPDRKKIPPFDRSAKVTVALVVLAIIIGILFCYTSATWTYTAFSGTGVNLIPDWKEALEWLGENTPDPGVDYLRIYAPGTFAYPAQSYGVMTWWDYGHMITYISKRIPNANPFQQGVAGPNGSAAFFVSASEADANRILDNLSTRYVITDTMMDTGKFPAMATWYNASLREGPYMEYMLIPQGGSDTLEARIFYTPLYYHTMVSRLHNLDGSMARPASLSYIAYVDSGVTNLSYPLIVDAETTDATNASALARAYNSQAPAGYHAKVISLSILTPADTVPALQHYRLVYESSTNSLTTGSGNLKFVKTFEYVRGAHIKGEGIIEIPLVTNTGRIFTYYQESVNGEFIVPYSTTGNSYPVRATGKYRIAGSDREYDVSEAAVMEGLTIN